MLVDTHCHLADAAFRTDLPAVLQRAWSAGVGHIVVIGESRAAADAALTLAQNEPRLSVTAGVHPHDASGWGPDAEDWLGVILRDPRVVALGEIGLDHHYDHSPRDRQRQAFDAQLDLARRLGKPAVIHAREADEDVAAVLRDHPDVKVILHSFSSGPRLLEAGLHLGAYVSFSGMATFKNWTMDDAVRQVPGDRLLTETDAPYLAPVPFRGRRNEPAFVRQVAERLAAVRGTPVNDLIASTGANAARVFGHRLSGSDTDSTGGEGK